MPTLNRPRIDETQLNQFKSDIKMLSKLIVNELQGYKSSKYPVTTTQNAYARKLDFDSFSEMNLLSVIETQNEDFCLVDVFTPCELFDIYKDIKNNCNKKLGLSHVENAVIEFKSRDEVDEGINIKLSELRIIINDDEYNEHHYTEKCGFPSEFKVDPKGSFFKKLQHEDHFSVLDGKEKKYYTVAAFNHIYTNKKVFKILSGKWWNIDTSPFCSGQH